MTWKVPQSTIAIIVVALDMLVLTYYGLAKGDWGFANAVAAFFTALGTLMLVQFTQRQVFGDEVSEKVITVEEGFDRGRSQIISGDCARRR